MSQSTSNAAVADVAAETTGLVIDAIASSNERAVQYAKSIWEIAAAKPAETDGGMFDVRGGYERFDKIVALTVKELETSIKKSAQFTESLVSQATKLQQSAGDAFRNLAESGLSNVKQAVEDTGERLETLSKRVEKSKTAA
jgi:hypothetical protein